MKISPCLLAVISLSSPFLHGMYRAAGTPAARPREVRSTLARAGAGALAAPVRETGPLTAEQRRFRHRPVRLERLPDRPSNLPGLRLADADPAGRTAALPVLARSKDFADTPPVPRSPASSAGSSETGARIDLGIQTAGRLQVWVTRPARNSRAGAGGQATRLAQVTLVNSEDEPLCFSLPKQAGSAAPYTHVYPSAPGMADLELHWELEPFYELTPAEEIQVKVDASGESSTYDITRADGTPYAVLELNFF